MYPIHLNTVIGNPNLEPANSHRVYIGYNGFDWQKKTGLYLNANAEFTNNEVSSKTTVDAETLKRTTTYENIDGNYNMGVYARYSKDFKLDSIRKIKFRAGAWSNFHNNINFNNDVQYA